MEHEKCGQVCSGNNLPALYDESMAIFIEHGFLPGQRLIIGKRIMVVIERIKPSCDMLPIRFICLLVGGGYIDCQTRKDHLLGLKVEGRLSAPELYLLKLDFAGSIHRHRAYAASRLKYAASTANNQ